MSKEKRMETILAMLAGLLVVYYFYPVKWLYFVLAGLAFTAILSDSISGFIAKGWLFFAEKLGGVMSKILLTVVFFGVLYPMSILQKLFSRSDSLMLKRRKDTYYTTRNHTYTASDLDKTW